MEPDHGTVRSRLDHAEFARVFLGLGDGGDGRVGALVDVVFQHLADVHAVNMIGAEDHHVMRIGLFDQVDVLVDGVGGAAIPVLRGRAHLRGHGNDEVLFEHAAGGPAFAQMLQQTLALELDEYVDRINSGIGQVAENEIDDAITSSEGNRGLGPLLGQRREARASSTGQNECEDADLHGPYSPRTEGRSATHARAA